MIKRSLNVQLEYFLEKQLKISKNADIFLGGFEDRTMIDTIFIMDHVQCSVTMIYVAKKTNQKKNVIIMLRHTIVDSLLC